MVGLADRVGTGREKVTSGAETHACAVKASFSGDHAVWEVVDRGSSAVELMNSASELGSSVTEKVFSVIELGSSVAEKVFSVIEKVFSEGERPGPSRKR